MNESDFFSKAFRPIDAWRILYDKNIPEAKFKIGQECLYIKTGQIVHIDGVNILEDDLIEYSVKEDDMYLYWEDELIEYGVC